MQNLDSDLAVLEGYQQGNKTSTVDSSGDGGPRLKNIDYQTLGCTATLPRNLERNTTHNSIPHQLLLPQCHLHLYKLDLKIDDYFSSTI